MLHYRTNASHQVTLTLKDLNWAQHRVSRIDLLGLGNFKSRYLEMSLGVTVILLGILSHGFIKQFIFLQTCPENKSLIGIIASYVFFHSVIVILLMTSSLQTLRPRNLFVTEKLSN